MGALSHLRIVEIGSAAATSYCARLFADFGATVQKVEPSRGDPLRRAAPLTPKGAERLVCVSQFQQIQHRARFRRCQRRLATVGIDRALRHPDRRPRRRCSGLSGLRSCRDQSAPSRPHSSRGELVWRRGALRPIRGNRFDHSRVDRIDQTGRAGRGTADACAGFPDRHPGRPVGIYIRGLIGAGPDAGRTRAQQPPEHFRIQHRRHRIHHVRGVFARRHHAPDRRQPVLADLSGRHL